MFTKATVVEVIRPYNIANKKDTKIELKSQQPWTAVTVLFGLNNMAQLADELWVPTMLMLTFELYFRVFFGSNMVLSLLPLDQHEKNAVNDRIGSPTLICHYFQIKEGTIHDQT